MRGMILAAGRGRRMGVLTNNTPKPLLRVRNQYLIEYAIQNFKQAGIHEIVINISYQASAIKAALGNGERYGVQICYSEETEPLETGGGIFHALELIGDSTFVVVSSDIVTNFPFKHLPNEPKGLAHLIVVNNPVFHPNGDFGLKANLIDCFAKPRFTFANIGVYRTEMFADCKHSVFPLSQLLFPAIEKKLISGELFTGTWYNVGTPSELEKVNSFVESEIT